MPKGTRKGTVQTGQMNFGKMGTSMESDVINSKGKPVAGNPEGPAAQRMIGDNGIKAHKRNVAKALTKVAKGKEGTYEKTVTTSNDDFSSAVEMVRNKKSSKSSSYQ